MVLRYVITSTIEPLLKDNLFTMDTSISLTVLLYWVRTFYKGPAKQLVPNYPILGGYTCSIHYAIVHCTVGMASFISSRWSPSHLPLQEDHAHSPVLLLFSSMYHVIRSCNCGRVSWTTSWRPHSQDSIIFPTHNCQKNSKCS